MSIYDISGKHVSLTARYLSFLKHSAAQFVSSKTNGNYKYFFKNILGILICFSNCNIKVVINKINVSYDSRYQNIRSFDNLKN